MRHDDMIATVLAQPADRADRLAVQWRQLVDLLAQRRGRGAAARAEQAVAFLRDNRDRVPAPIRREAAESLAGMTVDPLLVAVFAEDRPDIAAPLIGGVRLSGEEWIDLLPRLQPPARALLRHRRDLPAEVRRALGAFGASDFVLEGRRVAGGRADPEGATARADQGESQIRELVERIEAYRRHRETGRRTAVAAAATERAEEFRWETASDGMIRWVEGAPREALVGQSIAVIAGPGHHGVDGQAAGAFEKRAPFRDARFSVAGEGGTAGDWRISGVPFFDPRRGSFIGYRGTARRPRVDETARHAAAADDGLFGPQFPADSLRQLIHELRTPLNAIIGFAEMIEGQYLGPAASGYRGRAGDIVGQARRLLSAVDDLDTAARIETKRLDLAPGAVDAEALLDRLHASYQRVAAQRGAELRLDKAPDLPLARVEPEAAERMFGRLLAATIGLAGEGESLLLSVRSAKHGGRASLGLSVDRPAAIRGLDESALLDPGYSPDGDWPAAPALGLGFALRLVRNLADAAGGALLIDADRIMLHLPVVEAASAPAGNKEGGA